MSRISAAMDVVTRPLTRYNPGSISLRERLLFANVLALGGLLMLIAGQFALQTPRTWQINDTNMESKLNPNEVYALYHKERDLYLGAIRTDIPNLLSTPQDSNLDPGSFLPPPVVEFKAPARITTTTPFPIAAMTIAIQTASPAASATALAAVSSKTPTLAPTFTLEPTETPLPTSTRRPTRVPTRIPTRTPTIIPTLTLTRVIPATLTGTPTPTHTPVNTLTHTPASASTQTATPTSTAPSTTTVTPTTTATSTHTATHTATLTLTPTHTVTPTPTLTTQPVGFCPITGSNNYDIPVGGCTLTYGTNSQGAILSLDLVSPGSLALSWYGLMENQTSGACNTQAWNLTKGRALSSIAVAKGSTTTTLTIGNSTTKTMTVQITVTDWTTGGCN